MKSVNIYLAYILDRDGSENAIRLNMKKNPELKTFKFQGREYRFRPEHAWRMKGFYPWIRFKWANPFTLFKYGLARAKYCVGILRYFKVEPGQIGEPIQIPDPSLVTPHLLSAIVPSSLWKNRIKRQQFGKIPARYLLYMVIIFVLLFVFMIMTGSISFGG